MLLPPPLPPPPLPHAASTTSEKHIIHAAAAVQRGRRAGRKRSSSMVLNAKARTSLLFNRPCQPVVLPAGTVSLLPAVVVIVIVVGPLPVTVAGENEQLVSAGKPLQEAAVKLIVPV